MANEYNHLSVMLDLDFSRHFRGFINPTPKYALKKEKSFAGVRLQISNSSSPMSLLDGNCWFFSRMNCLINGHLTFSHHLAPGL
jgi:hypothetical protein